ncbi:hypothetical protein B4589_016265 (plasmid) [Halolamina sp. CBA1230]|uniref:hypothetical protein n=1 Tax=Halolamina sp. CBA1230 TaxID=1853690 RepID=UPI0009A13CFD|nr:hypothetical protein [Halolamina sp. CBA1230]QKY21966.1 hypothetical protein B4589_016265 [Halolamina sp. CBA1230]
MHRRAYLASVAGVAAAGVSGCLQGEAVLHENNISATSPTTEWEVELTEGDRMRLEVDRSDDLGAVTGYVHRAETDEEIVSTAASSGHEEFVVPATGAYLVSIEVDGNTGEIILREMG